MKSNYSLFFVSKFFQEKLFTLRFFFLENTLVFANLFIFDTILVGYTALVVYINAFN